MTQAQNAFDERYFELYVNPVLYSLRKMIAEHVEDGESAIDIGCQTGEQCAMLAGKCRRLIGLDTEEKHVAETRARMLAFKKCDVDIILGEWDILEKFSPKEFNSAVLMMTLHGLDWEYRIPVLQNALRIAEKVIVVDYMVPQPRTPHGSVARTAELLAGSKHFSNFQNFQKLGGLRALEKNAKVKPVIHRENDLKTAELVVYQRG